MIELSIYNPQDKQRLAQAIKDGNPTSAARPVYMCIGTEKVSSDSLGPRVGTLLNENLSTPIFVYGLCKQNITAENLCYCYKFIKKLHPNSAIVVIDAAVGTPEQIGKIQISAGGIAPGAATDKKLPQIGDMGIVGIVSDKNMKDFYDDLNPAKNRLVAQTAEFIAEAILAASKSANVAG